MFRLLVRFRSDLREYASRNYFFYLLAEILIYLLWYGLMIPGMFMTKWSAPLGFGLVLSSTIFAFWLFFGLDERRLKDFPKEMLKLKWFQLN